MNPVESFKLNGRKLIKYLAILLITLLIGAIFLFILIYIDIRDELQKETEQAIEYSILYSPIEEALETYTFNGEKPYDVIKGENESGESLYVFIPKNLTHTDEIKWIEEEAGLKKDRPLFKLEKHPERFRQTFNLLEKPSGRCLHVVSDYVYYCVSITFYSAPLNPRLISPSSLHGRWLLPSLPLRTRRPWKHPLSFRR